MSWWDLGRYIFNQTPALLSDTIVASTACYFVKRYNPDLTDDQYNQLYSMIQNVCHRYREGHPVYQHVLAILSLACNTPQATMEAYWHIVQVMWQVLNATLEEGAGMSNTAAAAASAAAGGPQLTPEQRAARQMPSDIEFSTQKDDDEYSEILTQTYGIDRSRVQRIPSELRRVLCDTLATKPTCPICFDSLVNETTLKIEPDVVALFQYLDNKPHCFLFNKEMVESWIESNDTPTNPVTRQEMHTREFFPLS